MPRKKGCPVLAKALLDRRKEIGLTQRELSQRMRDLFNPRMSSYSALSPTLIGQYERGEKMVTLDNLRALQSVLLCDFWGLRVEGRSADELAVCRAARAGEVGWHLKAASYHLAGENQKGERVWSTVIVRPQVIENKRKIRNTG